MRYKKLMMLAIFLVSLLAVSAVSAADNAADDVVSVEKTTTDAVKETTDEIPSVENDENGNILKKTSEENNTLTQTNNAETDSQILSEGEGTYSDLRDEIGSGGDINLTKRYYRYDGGDSIHISNPGVINGNGAVIDMNMSVRAFSVETSGVTFKNLTIKNGNSNGDSGGAICFMDFAIYGTVINCNFTGNSAYSGGAIWMNSGSVENCNFTGNSADCGGAVYLLNTCNVTNCNFTGNNVSSFGGAVHFFSTGSASNCNFTDNEAYYGGAVYFEGTGNVTNCNFADNSAYQGGAIFSQRQYTSVDTCIFKGNSGEDFNIVIYPPALNVDNFTTFYGSGEKLTFNLTTDSGMPVNNGNISISVYFKENGEWVGNYSCLSGEGWTVSLPVGSYYANFTTEYAGFQAINRTITITIPDVRYYINVTSITTNNKTVNITAKTNIPKDMIWDGKLLFILPNGDKIDANYGGYGLWWAEHTFDNYTTYQVNAEYVGLDHVNVSNAIINITRADSKITLDNITLDYGEIKNVTVETVGATKITASINGTNVTVLNNFTIQISDLSIGNHTLTVTTVPDYDHNPVTETAKITVNMAHTEITVDSETVDMKVSDEVPSGATLTPADAGNLTYKSSNETVVIVKDDKIKALGKGTATITVSFAGNENYTAAENMTITVNVDWADASVSVNNSTLDLVADDNFTIVATTDPAGLNVTFVPDDSGVVSVDENGVVTALKEGTATISVKVGGDGVYVENSTTVTVTVSKIPTEIKINRPWREMYVGVMAHVAAELLPSEVGNLSYVSNDTNVVTVSSTGVINANGAGTALITVSFNGTDKYAASSSSVNVLVNKAPTEIGANDLKLTFGDKSKLVYALAPENAEGNISFVSSNPDVCSVSSSGEITAVSAGTANVTITFSGNENYEKSNKTVKVKVAKANSTVRIGPSVLDYGNSLNVTADTTGAKGITAKINDQEVKVDGFAIEIPVLDAGKYTLTVTTIPEKNYYAVTENATLTVKKINSTLTVNDITFDYKTQGTTTATFTGATGITAEVINQPKAIVNVDGNKITISNLNPGTYTLSVTTIPDDNHNPVTKTAKITVNKLDTKLNATYDAKSKNIIATVKDTDGNPISGLKVGFAIDGGKNITTDADGQAKYSTANLPDGTYNVNVQAYGNETYKDSNKQTVKFTIENKKQTKIFLRNALYFVTQTKMVQVTLWDENNQPLANKTVCIRAYDSIWKGITDENGNAYIRVGIGFGVHNATVSFEGDDQYNASNRSGYIRVIKQTPSVMVRGADSQFKASDNNKIVKVHLRDRDDKPLPEGSKIVFKLNGKTYVGTTDINGVASIKISINTVGTFAAQAIYAGNSAYNAVTRDIKIRIV